MRVKPDGFPLSSRYARALNALARPFAHVSRALRCPVHGSLLTKNSAGLLNPPPGDKPHLCISDFGLLKNTELWTLAESEALFLLKRRWGQAEPGNNLSGVAHASIGGG